MYVFGSRSLKRFQSSCCRKGDPFQGPRKGSWLTLRSELSEDTHVLTKQKTLLGRGSQSENSRVREPRRTALPSWLTVSGFMVMGLVFRFSLANHLACAHIWSDSGSFLVACTSLSQDGFQCEGFWDVGRTILWAGVSSLLLAPSKFSWLVFGGSTMLLIGTSCCETTHASGYHHA